MNAEQFHDALTLLSPDLVVEAEEIRQRSKAPLRWKSLAAMDAAAPFWEAHTVSTPESATSSVNHSAQPKLTLVTCEEDWAAYCAAATRDLEALVQVVNVSRLSQEDLLLIELPTQTAQVTDVIYSENGWQVCLTEPTESTGSTIALWLPKGTVNSAEEIVLSWPEG